MKAVVQNFETGELRVADVPPPALQPGGILVAVRRSVISLGTERSVIEMAQKGPIGKARQRPDLARKVWNKARQEGLWQTYKVVKNLLASPLPLGYSCAGSVLEVGADVDGLRPGDPVACFGLSFANHAEVDYVPRNLAVPIPGGLAADSAAFVGIGAIAMQGVRLCEIELGSRVVVLGLGMIGQIAAQLARCAGAAVLAADLDPAKTALALELGAREAVADASELQGRVASFTGGHGADAVLVCAATASNDPMRIAAEISRLKGRVVVVGDVGLALERRPFFEKEVEVVISRSTGPGRFDPSYERGGLDYPLPYVRWTEQRNAAAFLDLLARGEATVEPLITHRFPIADAESAYRIVTGDAKPERAPVAILLEYGAGAAPSKRIELRPSAPARAHEPRSGALRLGVIGAGQFAKGVLLPAFAAEGVAVEALCTSSGLTSRSVGERYGAAFCTSDPAEVLASGAVDLVLVATRHGEHARLAGDALRAGKPVFVEKPLALDEPSLAELCALAGAAPRLAVGFNRRFSPLAVACRELFEGCADPIAVTIRVNAEKLPADSWVYDPVEGGGRILGEVCHFVDLACFLTGSRPIRVGAEAIEVKDSPDPHRDSVSVSLRMESGSLASIHYLTRGDPSLPKERIEVLGGGRAAVIDNFKSLALHRDNRRRTRKLMNQAKGHAEEVRAFVSAVRSGGPMPIAFEDLVAVTQTCLLIQESLERGQPVAYRPPSEG